MPTTELRYNAGFEPRFYQRPYMDAMFGGCKFAVWVMHRRGGKDRTALSTAAMMSLREQPALYWHCLPTQRQGRKVVWDNITAQGKRLIDTVFPREIVKRRIEDEMKVELRTGAIHQIVGADNFDSIVGANPRHVTFSEWSLTDPRAYDFVRPILRENGGSVSFIYTPRGRNHGWKTLEIARKVPGAFAAVMPITATRVLTAADMDMERRLGMSEELIQQEYYCDFNVANQGVILGRQIARAERERRIVDDLQWHRGSKIVVSSDIGYRDKAAFWWWQICRGGFELLHYDEASGLDAQDWIPRLQKVGLPIDKLWLPHDARAKTFATRHSVVEQMAQAFPVDIVPQTRLADRINAARVVMDRCRFHGIACERGLEALRNWQFTYDEEQRVFSHEPDHNWASHGGDAFSYGAQVLEELVVDTTPPDPRKAADRGLRTGANYAFTLDELWDDDSRERAANRLR